RERAGALPGQPLSDEPVGVLLARASRSDAPRAAEPLLRAARARLEASNRREIRDYFQDECVALQPVTLLDGQDDALVVYPVLLGERAELLVSDPRGIHRVPLAVTAPALRSEVQRLRVLLEDRSTHDYRRPAARLYA